MKLLVSHCLVKSYSACRLTQEIKPLAFFHKKQQHKNQRWAPLAQLVEHQTLDHKVPGLNLTGGRCCVL